MSNIVDLSLFEKETLPFKLPNGEIFTVPGEVSTKFVIKMSSYYKKLEGIEDYEKALEMMQDIVKDILNLDKSREDIDIDYVKDNLDSVGYLKAIIDNMMKHIQEISNDPN